MGHFQARVAYKSVAYEGKSLYQVIFDMSQLASYIIYHLGNKMHIESVNGWIFSTGILQNEGEYSKDFSFSNQILGRMRVLRNWKLFVIF